MAFEDLSAEELQARLAQMENERVLLEGALEQHHQARKGDLVVEVRNLILGAGYAIEEILPLVPGKASRRRRAARPAGSEQSDPVYTDPQDPACTYVRGRVPGWMKARMVEQGYDPNDKASREAFKTHYLVQSN